MELAGLEPATVLVAKWGARTGHDGAYLFSVKRNPARAASNPAATDARGCLRMWLDLGTKTGLVPNGSGAPLPLSRESDSRAIAAITGRPLVAGHLGEWIAGELMIVRHGDRPS
jgi:hypothetical protein